MKSIKVIFAALAILAAGHAQVAFADGVEDSPTNALQVALKAVCDGQSDDLIVREVFGEGTNSSFIVRTELTATQKRLIALGRQTLILSLYAQSLERRLAVIEAEREERLMRISVAREKREKVKRDADEKVRRAAQRAARPAKRGAK